MWQKVRVGRTIQKYHIVRCPQKARRPRGKELTKGPWEKSRDSELIKQMDQIVNQYAAKNQDDWNFLSCRIKWHFWLWGGFSLGRTIEEKGKAFIFSRFNFYSKTFSLKNIVSWVLWGNKFRKSYSPYDFWKSVGVWLKKGWQKVICGVVAAALEGKMENLSLKG